MAARSRWGAACAALLFGLLSAAPLAHAVGFTVYAGAGARIRPHGVEALASAQVGITVIPMVDITASLDAYISGRHMAHPQFTPAAVLLGVLWRPPIPGPIGVEMGLDTGALLRSKAHDETRKTLWMVGYELAVTSALGPARIRLSFQGPFAFAGGPIYRAMGYQLRLMAGVGF